MFKSHQSSSRSRAVITAALALFLIWSIGCTYTPTQVEATAAPTEEVTPVPTEAPTTEPTVEPTPEPTEEPAPEPTPEPIVTYSEYRIVPFTGDTLPEHYIPVTDADDAYTLCVFVGAEGQSEWRIYAERDVFYDGELHETETGFLKCHVKSAVIRMYGDPSYVYEEDTESGFVNYEEEVFGLASVYVYTENETNPYERAVNFVYGTYDDTNPDTMTEEPVYTYLYPAADGTPLPGAVPVEVEVTENGILLWYTVPGGDKVLIAFGELAPEE